MKLCKTGGVWRWWRRVADWTSLRIHRSCYFIFMCHIWQDVYWLSLFYLYIIFRYLEKLHKELATWLISFLSISLILVKWKNDGRGRATLKSVYVFRPLGRFDWCDNALAVDRLTLGKSEFLRWVRARMTRFSL